MVRRRALFRLPNTESKVTMTNGATAHHRPPPHTQRSCDARRARLARMHCQCTLWCLADPQAKSTDTDTCGLARWAMRRSLSDLYCVDQHHRYFRLWSLLWLTWRPVDAHANERVSQGTLVQGCPIRRARIPSSPPIRFVTFCAVAVVIVIIGVIIPN